MSSVTTLNLNLSLCFTLTNKTRISRFSPGSVASPVPTFASFGAVFIICYVPGEAESPIAPRGFVVHLPNGGVEALSPRRRESENKRNWQCCSPCWRCHERDDEQA